LRQTKGKRKKQTEENTKRKTTHHKKKKADHRRRRAKETNEKETEQAHSQAKGENNGEDGEEMGWQGARRTPTEKNKGAMRAAVLTRRAMVQNKKNEKQHTTERRAQRPNGGGRGKADTCSDAVESSTSMG
jgi:hypothetical protein